MGVLAVMKIVAVMISVAVMVAIVLFLLKKTEHFNGYPFFDAPRAIPSINSNPGFIPSNSALNSASFKDSGNLEYKKIISEINSYLLSKIGSSVNTVSIQRSFIEILNENEKYNFTTNSSSSDLKDLKMPIFLYEKIYNYIFGIVVIFEKNGESLVIKNIDIPDFETESAQSLNAATFDTTFKIKNKYGLRYPFEDDTFVFGEN
jgi:hypothetical protein